MCVCVVVMVTIAELLVDPLQPVLGVALPGCCANMIVNAMLVYVLCRYVLAPVMRFVGMEIAAVMDRPSAALASFRLEDACREVTAMKTGAAKLECRDPGTGALIGHVRDMPGAEVCERVARARRAQATWSTSSFTERRRVIRELLRYIVANMREICEVSCRDSGKAMLDAALGEVMTTCEKAAWLINHGEDALLPEKRTVGRMMFYKSARVEFVPVGVMGAIVPWNYPFHNLLNPILANIFAGNAIVIKASEHAGWSALVFEKMVQAALDAGGCSSPDLVQVVTGGVGTGAALVGEAGIDKLVFVGSTAVGRKVAHAAAANLTPVVLELGGKDPVIVCEDADMTQVVPTCLRAAFMSCGQNCAGGERFYVHSGIYDSFIAEAVRIVSEMKQGAPLEGHVDCGAMCMPGETDRIHALVKDAVAKGAKVLAGGHPAASGTTGQFFLPTVLVDVDHSMRIMKEEVFGPVMSVMRFETDDEAVVLANDCPFGLGSAVFSRSAARAKAIASQLECGMSSINDFATTYMCQSLPFGGVKESGYDRFAGIEGLRGCCHIRSIAEDSFPLLMDTRIPPFMQYPVPESGFDFASSLIRMFYGVGIADKIAGLMSLLKVVITGSTKAKGKAA